MLFAISVNNVGNVSLFGFVDEVCRRHAVLTHAHIKRAILLKRKAALSAIKLHRRNADIQYDAIDRRNAVGHQDIVHVRKTGRVKTQGAFTAARKVRTFFKGIGITVERVNARTASQYRLAVSTCTEGAIHDLRARGDGKRVNYFIQ